MHIPEQSVAVRSMSYRYAIQHEDGSYIKVEREVATFTSAAAAKTYADNIGPYGRIGTRIVRIRP